MSEINDAVLWQEIPSVYYFEKLFFVFWCFTIPFYVFILVFLINGQRKNVRDIASPFFKLCISTAVIDLLTLLNNYFGSIFPKWGWGREIYLWMGTPFLHVYFYIAWASGACQAASTALLASNRLYAILFPNKYQKVWRGKGLKCAMFLQFFIGMAMALPCLFDDVIFTENGHGGLIPEITDKSRSLLYFMAGGVFLGSNSIYLISAYCYLFITLRRRHKTQLMHSGGNLCAARATIKRREHKLFVMSSIIVVIQLTIVCFILIKLTNLLTFTIEEFYTIYNALSDIYSGANPYLLWIFSDALRNDVINTFKKKKNTNNAPRFATMVSSRY